MDGIYKVLGIPFGFVLELIYSSVGFGSYAVSIILLTFFARALTVPSSIKQQKGMAKTQRIQSKIRKIQTKYAGDQKKIQEETPKISKSTLLIFSNVAGDTPVNLPASNAALSLSMFSIT